MGLLLSFDINDEIFQENLLHSEICFQTRVIACNFVVNSTDDEHNVY